MDVPDNAGPRNVPGGMREVGKPTEALSHAAIPCHTGFRGDHGPTPPLERNERDRDVGSGPQGRERAMEAVAPSSAVGPKKRF